MSKQSFPHFTFVGGPSARGQAYGETLRERIEATFAFYEHRLFAKSPVGRDELRKRAEKVRSMLTDFDATLSEELDAIADAANLARWQIYLLNARTEILNAEINECTALCFPAAGLLGQTWDWFEGFDELGVMVTYESPESDKILAFTEPGMLAKIGLNSSGLGINLNFLTHPHVLNGLPVHLLIRAILGCRDIAAARAVIDRAGFGKSSHLLIADVTGDVLSIEFAGDKAALVEPENNAYVHTNHFIAASVESAVTDQKSSSSRRLRRTKQLLSSTEQRSFTTLQAILLDQVDGDFAINNPFHDSVNFPGERVGTCGTFIMELDKRALHVQKGPQSNNAFARIVLA